MNDTSDEHYLKDYVVNTLNNIEKFNHIECTKNSYKSFESTLKRIKEMDISMTQKALIVTYIEKSCLEHFCNVLSSVIQTQKSREDFVIDYLSKLVIGMQKLNNNT